MNGKDLRIESAAAVVVQGNGDIVMPEPSEEDENDDDSI